MQMKIQNGIVKYKDRNDIVCTYGVCEDGRQYYFLDEKDEKKFSNGNRIASKALVEAIDPMVKASSIGVIDENGNEVIPFDNKSIRLVNDDIILVEKAQPVSESVIASINMKNDPSFATKLVSTPAVIKEKLNSKMGGDGRYFFNDQFSEATVCDISGNNLVNDQYYSFIAMAGGKLYFSKNTTDSEIVEYSILPPEVQGNITPDNDSHEIDVKDVEVSKDVVEEALNEALNTTEYLAEDDTSVKKLDNDIEIPSISTDEEISVSDSVSSLTSDDTDKEEEAEVVDELSNSSTSEGIEEISDGEGLKDSKVEEEIDEENVSVSTNSDEDDSKKEEENVEDNKLANVEDEIDLNINFNDELEEHVDDLDEKEVIAEPNFDDNDLLDEDIFKDSILKVDKIVDDNYTDYEENGYRVRSFSPKKDNIIMDVADSMANLIRQNKEQKNVIIKYQDRFEKLNIARRGMADKVKEQEQKIEVLTSKLRSMEATLTKLESRNQLLESKNRDQEKIISSQTREIEELRPQLAGKEDLIRVLADAQLLLEQETYSYDDYRDGYYKNIA